MKTSTTADLFMIGLATLFCTATLYLSACDGNGSNADVNDDADDLGSEIEYIIEYIKASNTEADDSFGSSVALSGDGNTLAVGVATEDSSAEGPKHPGDPDYYTSQDDNSATNSGAVYVFIRSGITWNQQAYIKASLTEAGDQFGSSVALSDDGNTLAVGAWAEDGDGVSGLSDNSISDSGAVYIFTRSNDTWDASFYVKASNPGEVDKFGETIALSGDGLTLAVGVQYEDSCDIDGPEGDGCPNSGAVYVFVNDASFWYQQAYLKATGILESEDHFGIAIALSDDGDTLAVGASMEDSDGSTASDNSAQDSGAVYVFSRFSPSGIVWDHSKYLKTTNPKALDRFGESVALSGDGGTLAVGAPREDSDGSSEDDNSAQNSGAVYVFTGDDSTWRQTSYLKAPNIDIDDEFGGKVALSRYGDSLAVRALGEDSGTTGINGDMNDNSADNAGAVYLFPALPGSGLFLASYAYIKASNTEEGETDWFSWAIALSNDGDTLAVGAFGEDSSATGIGGDASDNSQNNSGAVYLYSFE